MEYNCTSKILWMSFLFFEKMGNVGRFVIGECVTAKAIHVLHLIECPRHYGSDKKTKRLVGLVVTNVNIPTTNGRASWFVRGSVPSWWQAHKAAQTECSVSKEIAHPSNT